MRSKALILLYAGLLIVAVSLVLKAVRPGLLGYAELAEGDGVEIGDDVLVLNEFRVPKYPGGRPRQYESDVHVINRPTGEKVTATISVNHPLRWKGKWIYQNSYDAETERQTVLLVSEDPHLVWAVIGGALLLAGAFLGIFAFRTDDPLFAGGWLRRTVSVVAALAVLALPVIIISRSVLKPEPIPALQSPLLAPHVAAYMLSYLVMIFATFGIGRRFMGFGFFMMAVGLVLGAVWGKICWGDFWQYDPKEMWSLFTFLTYLVYFSLRRFRPLERLLRILGLLMVLFTLTYVNFSRFFAGIHSYA